MHVQFRRMLLVGILAAVPLTVTACGDSKDKKSGGSGTKSADTGEKQKGGTLTLPASSDVDYINCRAMYYQLSFVVARGICRTLYSYAPDQKLTDAPTPDLAEGPPEISDDQKTVTVKLKKGIKFAPPSNREITAADIKYSIESSFTPNIPNGYVGTYLSPIQGAPKEPGKLKDIPGIQVVDDSTIKFVLTQPVGGDFAAAMVLPTFTATDRKFAEKYDTQEGGVNKSQIATGPYMIESDAQGKLIGYKPGKQIKLVRNPNWDPSTDYRKAYLDQIIYKVGASDAAISARDVLSGQSKATIETMPPNVLSSAKKRNPDQVYNAPSGGGRYVAFNSAKPPFDNINLRKAVFAAMNRVALRATRGGELVGPIAQHYIPPGFPAFNESGGEAGFKVDFLAQPEGNPELAKEYMKKAGFPSGKYTGKDPITLVGANVSPGKETALAVEQQLKQLGFKVQVKLAPQNIVYSKNCNVPKNQPNVCPNVGWFKDYVSPKSMLEPLFSSEAINPENNANWGQTKDPEIDKAIKDASLIKPGPENLTAWAKVNELAVNQANMLPYVWDSNISFASKNVIFSVDPYNALVDITDTAIKK